MKTTTILQILCLAILMLSCKSNTGDITSPESDAISQVNDNETSEPSIVKKYGIKSGIITFEMDAMGIKTKSVLYFDDWGTKEAEEEYDGENIKKVNLCDGKSIFNIIMSDKTAYISGSCYRGIAYRFDWNEISSEDQGTKAKKLPNIQVADKDCESFSYDMESSSTIYAGWQNICLFQETKSKYGSIIKKAIKVEENVNVPADKLKLPEGFEVKQSGFMQ